MSYANLRDFLRDLEAAGELRRIRAPVDPVLEITEICQRTLKAGGPALLFEHPEGSDVPLLGNLFGSTQRVARAIGRNSVEELREVGKMLAFLKEPQLPRGLKEVLEKLPAWRQVLNVPPRTLRDAPCRERIIEGPDVDLAAFPIQHCWPEDAGRLITFGLVITKGPYKERQNIGIYRQQVIAKNKVIMRWLHHRGGAIDFREFQEANPGKPFPLAVVIGADPATLLAAVAPIPDTLSEFEFAGLCAARAARWCPTSPGHSRFRRAPKLYWRDTSSRARLRSKDRSATTPATTTSKTLSRCSPSSASPIATGRSTTQATWAARRGRTLGIGDGAERGVHSDIAEAVPGNRGLLSSARGLLLPRGVREHQKRYPGHARRIMFGVWSYLRQFTYTKFIIVTDDDINVRDWKDVIWAMTTRMDPARDTLVVENTPIDYLDFASPQPSLGGKLGLDATNKWPGETNRAWGKPIAMSEEVKNGWTNSGETWESVSA